MIAVQVVTYVCTSLLHISIPTKFRISYTPATSNFTLRFVPNISRVPIFSPNIADLDFKQSPSDLCALWIAVSEQAGKQCRIADGLLAGTFTSQPQDMATLTGPIITCTMAAT